MMRAPWRRAADFVRASIRRQLTLAFAFSTCLPMLALVVLSIEARWPRTWGWK